LIGIDYEPNLWQSRSLENSLSLRNGKINILKRSKNAWVVLRMMNFARYFVRAGAVQFEGDDELWGLLSRNTNDL